MVKMELLWKCLIWYYEYTLESEYILLRICQDSKYARDTQGSEFTWVCSWLMLLINDYAIDYMSRNMPETEPKFTLQLT